MSDERPQRRRSLDSLRKEAKRWLAALRANDADARARLERALPDAPADADAPRRAARARARARLFRVDGAQGALEAHWRRATIPARRRSRSTRRWREALLEAYRTGTPEAMERHYQFTWHRRAWRACARTCSSISASDPSGPDDDVDITLDDARHLVALEHGFENWDALQVVHRIAGADGASRRSRCASFIRQSGDDERQTLAARANGTRCIRLARHASRGVGSSAARPDDGRGARGRHSRRRLSSAWTSAARRRSPMKAFGISRGCRPCGIST